MVLQPDLNPVGLEPVTEVEEELPMPAAHPTQAQVCTHTGS